MGRRQFACVQFEDVSKVYRAGVFPRRSIRALAGVWLEVFPGDVFGILGPNRAGKTTLIKLLLALCRPSGGRIRRLGRDVTDRRTLARVGYLHERPNFPPYLTAERLLAYFGTLASVPASDLRRRIPDLLARVDLADCRATPIACYSKGMLQRLALAQALVNQPELLVLDEPTEGMDIGARRLVRQVVTEHRAAGGTTILVSHALGEVEKLCNRLAVLKEGRIVFSGPLDELLVPVDAVDPQQGLEDALAPLYDEALV
jgi:ABC-2 type transport system ATP-binding protein